jgi:hypothetical protein
VIVAASHDGFSRASTSTAPRHWPKPCRSRHQVRERRSDRFAIFRQSIAIATSAEAARGPFFSPARGGEAKILEERPSKRTSAICGGLWRGSSATIRTALLILWFARLWERCGKSSSGGDAGRAHRTGARIAGYDRKIREPYRNSEICQRLGKVEGIGPVTATALIAAVGDRSSFKNGRPFAAWLGLVPKPRSSGGHARLFGISNVEPAICAPC